MLSLGTVRSRGLATSLVVTGAALGGLALWMSRRRRPQITAPDLQVPQLPFGSDERDLRASVASSLASSLPQTNGHSTLSSAAQGGLVEPASAELPLGRSAERELDLQLVKSRLPQPESSGAALLDDAESRSDSQLEGLDSYEEGQQLTARPHSRSYHNVSADDYDAVSPEDLGTSFLARATETSSDIADDELDDVTEIPGFELSTMSEGSSEAAQMPDGDIDSQRQSPLDDDDDGERTTPEPASLPDEVLAEVFDRPESGAKR